MRDLPGGEIATGAYVNFNRSPLDDELAAVSGGWGCWDYGIPMTR